MVMRHSSTQTFGNTDRVGHDSSVFYNSNLYSKVRLTQVEDKTVNSISEDVIDNVFCKSSVDMSGELPDNSVHLVITSPPYNVSKDYDDNLSLDEYFELLRNVFSECYRVLVNGGRCCVNIANVGRKPYIPLEAYLTNILNEMGFNYRGQIIWDKGNSANIGCSWGSWQSASNPTLRDVHEYILVFSKGDLKRTDKGESTISKEEFLEYTKSIWQFNTVSAKKIGHPAPFPIELPERLIKLYSYKDDIVLDPFLGSGTTAVAAIKNNRHYIGYELNEEYVELSKKRIDEIRKETI